jgi:hypothetical protein
MRNLGILVIVFVALLLLLHFTNSGNLVELIQRLHGGMPRLHGG